MLGRKAYWTPHALVIILSSAAYAVPQEDYLILAAMTVVVVGGTYAVSRFLNRGGWDIHLRAFLYATIPFWFLIK